MTHANAAGIRRRYIKSALGGAAALGLAACAGGAHPRAPEPAAAAVPAPRVGTPEAAAAAQAAAADQVIATERAFARTMADRDFKAFLRFLSPEAVFFSGSRIEHGPAEIAAAWQPYFSGSAAPFAWAPDHVEVLASGTLALSTGPVTQQGQLAGRFNSVWRLEAPNTWRIVFDKGEAVCGAP